MDPHPHFSFHPYLSFLAIGSVNVDQIVFEGGPTLESGPKTSQETPLGRGFQSVGVGQFSNQGTFPTLRFATNRLGTVN